jgi:hypothetical protein
MTFPVPRFRLCNPQPLPSRSRRTSTALRSRSRVIAERRLQASAVVPVGHTFDLPMVPANRLRCPPDRLPGVEVLERQDSPSHTRRELLLFQTFQLVTVSSPQLQPRGTLRLDLHPNA